MRKIILILIISILIISPVMALEIEPPPAPSGLGVYPPESTTSFAEDLLYIIKQALSKIAPDFAEAMNLCAAVIAIQILISVIYGFSGAAHTAVKLASVIAVSILLLNPSRSLITMGIDTIKSLCEYNKLLLPVMTTALASQGGTATSAALYSGTVVLNSALTLLMSKVITPMLSAYIVVGIAGAAVGEKLLKQTLGFFKWLITWILKVTAYLFTGYMGITGVVCGTVDASAMKAAKLTISGSVPVIGNIISDASEAVLVGAGVIKNSVGIYGALVILAIWITPFLHVGLYYLLMKITSGISSLIGDQKVVAVVSYFSSAMGFVLAMIGVACVLQLVSVVCFLKGVHM